MLLGISVILKLNVARLFHTRLIGHPPFVSVDAGKDEERKVDDALIR